MQRRPQRHTFRINLCVLLSSCFSLAFLPGEHLGAESLPVAEIQRDTPVDFVTEIYPLLKQNCLACHQAKDSEGGLNLETHEALVKGGDNGAGVVAKDLAESLVFTRAAGQLDDLMPPEDNDVGAKTLTAKQLGLLKLWIQQGAKGGDVSQAETIQWQPIPESVRTIYAVDASSDGQFVAAGRGNRVVIYDVASAKEVARLADPDLEPFSGPGVADVDLIQSIAFSPDGLRIATGGYRTVRLWRKSPPQLISDNSPWGKAAGLIATNSDQSQAALVNAVGDIEVWDAGNETKRHTLVGHADVITGLAWSAASDRLFSCDISGELLAWNTSTGERLAQLESETAWQFLAASADGSFVAAIDSQRKPHVWKLDSTDPKKPSLIVTPLAAVDGIPDAGAIAFSAKPSPQIMVASGKTALIVDIANGKEIRKLDHGGPIDAIAINPTSDRVATGGRDGKILLWNLTDGKKLKTIEGSPQSRRLLADAQRDTERQKKLLAAMNTKTTELEKAVTKEDEVVKKLTTQRDEANKQLQQKTKAATDAIAKVTATQAAIAKANTQSQESTKVVEAATRTEKDASTLVAKLNQVTAKRQADLNQANEAAKQAEPKVAAAQKELADAKALAEKITKEIEADKTAINKANDDAAKAKAESEAAQKVIVATKAAIEASNKKLAGEQKASAAADEAKKKSEAEVNKQKQALAAATQAQQRATTAIPRHKQVLAAATRRSKSFEDQLTEIQKQNAASSNACVDVSFSRDGSQITSVHAGGFVRLYRTSDGLAIASIGEKTNHSGAVVTDDGRLCLFARSGRSEVWSTDTKWQLERVIGPPVKMLNNSPISDRVTAMDFRRDGLSLAVGSGPPSRFGDVKVFAVDTGQIVRDFGELHSDTVLGVRFSPDGKLIATAAADKTLRVSELATGNVLRSFEGHTHHVLAADWQDDGRVLASASADQNIKVWNAETGEQNKTIAGFGKEITAVAFVGQSNQVITACADGNLRLHDTGGKLIRTFGASGDFLYTLAITQDGKTLVAGGQSGVLRLWNIADGKLLHEVK